MIVIPARTGDVARTAVKAANPAKVQTRLVLIDCLLPVLEVTNSAD
jgi:hypothetical protein